MKYTYLSFNICTLLFMLVIQTNGQTSWEKYKALPEPSMTGLANEVIAVELYFDDLLYLVGLDTENFLEMHEMTRMRIVTELREAGITVTNDEMGKIKYPYFYISIYLIEITNDVNNSIFAFYVKSGLDQKVVLKRDKSIEVNGTTWQRIKTGSATRENILTELNQAISEKTKEFIIELLKSKNK